MESDRHFRAKKSDSRGETRQLLVLLTVTRRESTDSSSGYCVAADWLIRRLERWELNGSTEPHPTPNGLTLPPARATPQEPLGPNYWRGVRNSSAATIRGRSKFGNFGEIARISHFRLWFQRFGPPKGARNRDFRAKIQRWLLAMQAVAIGLKTLNLFNVKPCATFFWNFPDFETRRRRPPFNNLAEI